MKITTILLILLLPLLILFSPRAFSVEDCEIIRDSCDYYLCRERQHPCGRRGYNLALGHRYCRKFLLNRPERYSEKGRLWLSDVRQCLQEKLEELPVETLCRRVRSRAMNNHVDCYLDTGFCGLSVRDKQKVLNTVGSRLLDPFFLVQGLKVLFRCPK